MTMTPEDQAAFYKDMAEMESRENSNLRHLLLWCARRIPTDEVKELSKLINRPFEDGGVIRDSAEDREEELLKVKRAIVALTDHVQALIDERSDTVPDGWYGRADGLCNQLRGYLDFLGEEETLLQVRILT